MITILFIVFAKRKIKEIISVSLNYKKRVLKMGRVIYCSAVDIASISSKSMKERSMTHETSITAD